MDKEEARFILRCFRPEGADAENPDFAEALAWAAKDRELGEWLADERSSDADFANALNAVDIPPTLREEILAGLAFNRDNEVRRPDAFDAHVIGALAAVSPPAALRGEILSAMERTAHATTPRRWGGWTGLSLAAAAGIAMAFLISKQNPEPANPNLAGVPAENGNVVPAVSSPLPISVVEAGFIRAFEAPGFTLDLKDPDHHALFDHLKSAELPCPKRCLPKGLKAIPGFGCRELEIDGKRGALVCFKQENDIVHLMVFKRSDVKCKLPATGEPRIRTRGKWSVACWEDADRVFVLMGENNVDTKRLAEMF